jgi:signal transduction histidine kinase
MTKSLKGKFIFSFLVVALITVLVVSAFIRITSGQSLSNLVIDQQQADMLDSVQSYFTANGTLEGFHDFYSQQFGGGRGQSQSGTGGGGGYQKRDARLLIGLVDPNNIAVIPTLGYEVGQQIPDALIKKPIDINVDGQVIARMFMDNTKVFQPNAEETRFIQRTNLAIGLAAGTGILVAILVGFIISGMLLKPIRLLTKASRSLSTGKLEQQIPVTSSDELGELTRTFNQMSLELARVEEQRKRLTADITHDLSTPLQILSGYMEMIKDGQVALTPQRVEIMNTEIDHLKRLVGDLTMLTQAETGSLQISMGEVDTGILLNHIFEAYHLIAAKQGIDLVIEVAADLPRVNADEGRLLQVLKNLVENALRYTQSSGRITLGSQESGDEVELYVMDTGIGIAQEDLPFIFDRFYRADKARGGNGGKMGLGLAISKALVDAQGGIIRAESEGIGKGTRMVIVLKTCRDY